MKKRSLAALFSAARRELFPAVVGDVMDSLNLRHQFLPPSIRPLQPGMVILGLAMPVLGVSVCEASPPATANPLLARDFGLMFAALDDLKAGEVYVCTGSRPNHALWGELMTTRALKLRAAGVVCDGYVRDTKAVLRTEFPTFAAGSYGQDSRPRYKVVDFRVPIEIGSVRINPGDVVFGDIDGVCIVPHAALGEVFGRALEKVRGENCVRKAIKRGLSATNAWEKFGIM